jgi:leucyl aminopeptidase
VLVVPVLGQPAYTGPLGELDSRSGKELSALTDFGELRGKRFKAILAGIGSDAKIGAKRILLVNAGPPADLDRESVVKLSAAAIRRLAGRKVDSLAVWLAPLADVLEGGAAAVAELVARGVVEGGYEPARIYRDGYEEGAPELKELVLVATGEDAGRLAKAAERGTIIGEGANIARTLANRSSNDVSPEVLAEEAYTLAKKHGLWIDVIGPEKATEMGMGLFMAVGRGSDNPPRMIVMRSGKKGEKDTLGRHLAIVGKGVCFDSGGISIKPSDRMEEM